MPMLPLRHPSTGGFSNQQALLALLVVFPLGMMCIGMVVTLVLRSTSVSTAQAPAPAIQTPAPSAPPASEQPEIVRPAPAPSTPAKPLANPGSATPTPSSANTCWFQMQRGGPLIGDRCSVTLRVNVNGDRVFDVIEPSGLKRSVVLWENDDVEVFLNEQRYTGSWLVDDEGDVRVSLPGGTFAFTPPR